MTSKGNHAPITLKLMILGLTIVGILAIALHAYASAPPRTLQITQYVRGLDLESRALRSRLEISGGHAIAWNGNELLNLVYNREEQTLTATIEVEPDGYSLAHRSVEVAAAGPMNITGGGKRIEIPMGHEYFGIIQGANGPSLDPRRSTRAASSCHGEHG